MRRFFALFLTWPDGYDQTATNGRGFTSLCLTRVKNMDFVVRNGPSPQWRGIVFRIKSYTSGNWIFRDHFLEMAEMYI